MFNRCESERESGNCMEGLKFNSKGHVYTYNGVQVPSVTQIMKFGGCDKGLEFVDPKVVQRAGVIGKYVHYATELLDRDILDENSLDEIIAPYVEFWKNFKEDSGLIIKVTEHTYYSKRYGFAGTIDRIGRITKNIPRRKIRGKNLILDIKSGCISKKIKLQLAAYRELIGDKDLAAMAVSIKPNKYSTHYFMEGKEIDDCFEEFKQMLDNYNEFYYGF